jgi:carbamoyl-phosphate synthase small subunit
MIARLILSDGTHYEGLAFGKPGTAVGEVVFHTAMCGYQEILTDPSYHFQLVTMTYPQIGNYGVNPRDFESRRIYAAGFIIREYSPIVSHWQANRSLDDYLTFHGVVGISDIDTRALTRHLRDHGAQMGLITTSKEPLPALIEKLRSGEKLVGRDIVKEVTTDQTYAWPMGEAPAAAPERKYRVAVYDFGVKFSILRSLYKSGCELEVFPARTPPEKILDWKPDGIFLSNGPGDPEPCTYAIAAARVFIDTLPTFGICLGHQILGLACGGRTYKLKFGHRGANHPVKNLETGQVEITSQNHGFCIEPSLFEDPRFVMTHRNLNDGTVEGFRMKDRPVLSVQHHPEASPGPHDSHYLFEQFVSLMRAHREGR